MMKTQSTSAAADPWPMAYAVMSYRPSGGKLTLEIPGLSEAPLLAALAHAVHMEMRAAGEWAARIGEPWENGVPGPRDFCRFRAETAARLHAIYTALHGCAGHINTLDPSPEALKASASFSYAAGRRDEQARRQKQDKSPFPRASIEH